jgi:membrane-bound lytic murein transglycosylase MltF
VRAFFGERARRHNSHTADPTSVIPRVRTMVLAFGLLANVASRSDLYDAAQTAPTKSEGAQATTSLAVQGAAWTGDFDEMLKRRYMRVLVASSKTQYYVVKGIQHGTSYEEMKAFEDWVNRKYPQKTKNLKFHVVFVPVSRNQFLPRLTEGRGDLAVGAITITPERAKVVDFSQPMATVASYNAGPGRIHSLRQEAAKKGLDPNVWTSNVELIAAARIGMETVTYVSNIYKYYIAYKLVAEREQERQAERDSQLKIP